MSFGILLKKIRNSEDYRSIAENFFSLTLLQIITYLMPLIIFPYLTRVLGPKKFGLWSYAQSLLAYFGVLVNFGFNIVTVGLLASNRDKESIRDKIFTATILSQLFLFTTSILLVFLLSTFIKLIRDNLLFFTVMSFSLFGEVLASYWFYRGMEKMKYLVYLQLLGRGLFTIWVFVFVRRQEEFLRLPFLYLASSLIMALTSLYLIFLRHKVKLIRVTWKDMGRLFSSSFKVFVANSSINLISSLPIFVLGAYRTAEEVSLYVVPQRIVSIITNFYFVFIQSAFPVLSRVSKVDAHGFKRLFRRVFTSMAVFGGLAFILLLAFPGFTIRIIAGASYIKAIPALRVLSFLIIPSFINRSLSFLYLAPHEQHGVYSTAYFFASLECFILLLLSAPRWGFMGVAFVAVITEVLVLVHIIISEKRKGKIGF